MDVREIVRAWLFEHGREELECRSYECRCTVRDDDFMVCCPYRGCVVSDGSSGAVG